MQVRVRLFAVQRELAGTREVGLELRAGATIADAWDALVERHPVLAPGRASVRFARNSVYSSADEVLADGDEVAMIPPVSGGSEAGRPGEPSHRILELRSEPLSPSILTDLTNRLATPADGAVVGFLGVTRASDEMARPGGLPRCHR